MSLNIIYIITSGDSLHHDNLLANFKSFQSVQIMKGYDIVGDVHGHALLLERLLGKLGYETENNSFHHPLGRKIIFVGDLINRGPDSVKVLRLIQRMHDQKQAFCVLGNHEFRLLQQYVKDPYSIEMKFLEFIPWIKTLPFFLEFPEFRVVHAAWHFSSIEKLKNQNVENEDFIRSTIHPDSEFKNAIKIILQGIKVPIPSEITYLDRFAIKRKKARIRWWEKNKRMLNGTNIFPACKKLISAEFENKGEQFCEYYSKEEKIVFFGHYCLPEYEPKVINNLVCLDGCVTCNQTLWGYQYHKREIATSERLVRTN